MQSTTPVSSAEYDSGMILTGKWCYNEGPPEAQELYGKLYGIYLTNGGMNVRATMPTQRRARQANQNVGPQTRAATETPTSTRQRSRTTAGTPGPQDAKVLAKIVASPGITVEPLRRELPRTMQANIIGTSIGRLFKFGYISGTPKVGPFQPTEQGIAANNAQPAQLSQRRRAATRQPGAAAESQAQRAQAG